jgi:hypothetical protein
MRLIEKHYTAKATFPGIAADGVNMIYIIGDPFFYFSTKPILFQF